MDVFVVYVINPWDYSHAEVSIEVFMTEAKAKERYDEIKARHEQYENTYWYHRVQMGKRKVN